MLRKHEQSLKVVTANVSGLAKAITDGFFNLPHITAADVVCVQETRCEDARKLLKQAAPYYNVVAADRRRDPNGKATHGGVAILSRLEINDSFVVSEISLLHSRGQFVSAEVNGIQFASIYVSLSNTLSERLAFDVEFRRLSSLSDSVLLCGDFNIFRGPQSSYRWAAARDRNEVGTDYEAVKWLNSLFDSGWIDVAALNAKGRLYP
jgi:exodeoxyribonuclease-3